MATACPGITNTSDAGFVLWLQVLSVVVLETRKPRLRGYLYTRLLLMATASKVVLPRTYVFYHETPTYVQGQSEAL